MGRPDPAAAIEAYAACGGYPLHLRYWDPSSPAADNLLRLAARPGGTLARSGERMLVDLPGEGGHRRVLHAIGAGATKRGDIERDAGQRGDRALDLLVRTSLVRPVRPVGSPDRSPRRFEIADAYLRFWHEMIWADQGLIDAGQGEQVLARRDPRWQRHLGWVFEEEARRHVVRAAAAGVVPPAVYGQWWATRGQQVEVDVCGLQGGRTC